MLSFQFSDSQNPKMVNKGLTSVSTSMPPIHSMLSNSSSPSNLQMRDRHDETLIQQSSLDLDPTVVLAPRDFTTRDLEHPIFGLSPCETPSS
jgi:hypothetical protein